MGKANNLQVDIAQSHGGNSICIYVVTAFKEIRIILIAGALVNI